MPIKLAHDNLLAFEMREPVTDAFFRLSNVIRAIPDGPDRAQGLNASIAAASLFARGAGYNNDMAESLRALRAEATTPTLQDPHTMIELNSSMVRLQHLAASVLSPDFLPGARDQLTIADDSLRAAIKAVSPRLR